MNALLKQITTPNFEISYSLVESGGGGGGMLDLVQI